MKPWELYNYQKDIDYRTNTFDYDWRVKVVSEEKTIYVFSQFSTSILDWIVNFLFFHNSTGSTMVCIFCVYGVADYL